jgi:Ca-activated chloride channel family protein
VLIEHPLLVSDIRESIDETSADYRFSAAVAGFAQLLKQDTSLGSFSYEDVLVLAQPARGDDLFGYRAEFINLVRTASALN